MKKYIILLIVLILISCQCNKGKGFPSDRYVDNIQHIEYKIQKYNMGSVLTVGDVQITFAPNGHIMGIKNKSLKDGHIRNYYFLDKRDKDEISHFYTWKSHTNLTHPGKYFRPSKVKIMRPTSPK